MGKTYRLLVFLSLTWWQCTMGYNITDIVRLKQYVLDNYDASIRPIVNQSNPVKVSLFFALTNTIQIDMTHGQLEAVGYIAGVWTDEFLSWTDTEFSDIPRLALEDDDVWTPDVTQSNAIGEEVEQVSVVVEKNGTVFWTVSRRYTTFCSLNMRYYPRDRHDCDFEFISSRYPVTELELTAAVNGADLGEMRMHGEWSAEQSSVSTKAKTKFGMELQGIVYRIIFERRPEFEFVHKTIPLLLLVISNLFVHIIPLTSGERVSYAVTVLLAFVFWQAIVTEELPKNSAKISLLSVLMTICMILSTFSTINSVILSRIADCSGDHPIPKSLCNLAKRLRWNKYSYTFQSRYESKVSKHMDGDSNLEDQGSIGEMRTGKTEQDVTWIEAANALDFIALIIHLILTIIVTVAFVIAYAI